MYFGKISSHCFLSLFYVHTVVVGKLQDGKSDWFVWSGVSSDHAPTVSWGSVWREEGEEEGGRGDEDRGRGDGGVSGGAISKTVSGSSKLALDGAVNTCFM